MLSLISTQISSLTGFFAGRHLSEEASRDAHRRVYHRNEGEDVGNKTLGGAAAYQAFLSVITPILHVVWESLASPH